MYRLSSPVAHMAAPHTMSVIEDSQQLKAPLEEQLRFERLLTEFSTTFISLPASEVDKAIDHAQQRIVEFLGVDRCALWEVSEDGTHIRLTHAWTTPGLDLQTPHLSEKAAPWMVDVLVNRRDVLPFSRLDELPPEASQVRALFEETGLKSVIIIPLEMGSGVIGGLTLSALREEHTWPETLIPQLKRVGRILAHALQRKRAGLERQSLARELNEPLAAILSNAQAAQRFLAQEEPDLDEIREILADIVADDKRADEVIRRLRDLLK